MSFMNKCSNGLSEKKMKAVGQGGAFYSTHLTSCPVVHLHLLLAPSQKPRNARCEGSCDMFVQVNIKLHDFLFMIVFMKSYNVTCCVYVEKYANQKQKVPKFQNCPKLLIEQIAQCVQYGSMGPKSHGIPPKYLQHIFKLQVISAT